jgi:hypothetical protein
MTTNGTTRDAVWNKLQEILKHRHYIAKTTPDTTFEHHGVTAEESLEIFDALADACGVTVDDSFPIGATTFGGFVDIVCEALAPQA